MKTILLSLLLIIPGFAFSQLQKPESTNNESTGDIVRKDGFKIYATGVKSEQEAQKIEDEFKRLKGVYKVSHKFKSAESTTTLFIVYVENTFNSREDETTSFHGVYRGTFKDKLLELGYNIYDVKQIPVKE